MNFIMIAKILFFTCTVVCTNSSKVKFIRLRDVPARHCTLKNCQFCAKSFELDLKRFLPQKWSRAGRIVCSRMLQQENCCGEYLKMSRWMMFQWSKLADQNWPIKTGRSKLTSLNRATKIWKSKLSSQNLAIKIGRQNSTAKTERQN